MNVACYTISTVVAWCGIANEENCYRDPGINRNKAQGDD
jgi:hypothetical protein